MVELFKSISVIFYIVTGIVIFITMMIFHYQMGKELKGGKVPGWWHNFPYLDKNMFTEKGNTYRKLYNKTYYLMLCYIILFFVFNFFYA